MKYQRLPSTAAHVATLLTIGLAMVLLAAFIPNPSIPGAKESRAFLPAQDKSQEAPIAYLMDVQIASSQSSLTKTSSSVGSSTNIGSCITYQWGSGETYGFYYYEVPSGGGGDILKASGYVTGPWSGCHFYSPTFTVNTNSAVKVVIVSNSGVQSVHQVDAW